jgi:hypothetical protein
MEYQSALFLFQTSLLNVSIPLLFLKPLGPAAGHVEVTFGGCYNFRSEVLSKVSVMAMKQIHVGKMPNHPSVDI